MEHYGVQPSSREKKTFTDKRAYGMTPQPFMQVASVDLAKAVKL
jgi:hypothetical protein